MKQQVFPRNKLKNKKNKKTIHAVGETGSIVNEFMPNLRDFPICRMDPK